MTDPLAPLALEVEAPKAAYGLSKLGLSLARV